MPHAIEMRFIICCFFCLLHLVVRGQKNDESAPFYAEKQVEFRHDNDFLQFTDRYYSSGNYIGYRQLLPTQNDSISKRQLHIYLQQEFYTPTDLDARTIPGFDRPYAGFSGFSSGLTFSNLKRVLKFDFLIGVTGKISGVEGLQSLFHSTNDSREASWVSQIDDSAHFNFYSEYVREWELMPNPFSVLIALKPNIALGTKDIYAANELAIYFGKRNAINQTMAYQQLGEIKKEFFIALKATYKYVVHDAMLEGNITGDNSEFTIAPKDNQFQFGIEGFYRSSRNDFRIGYVYVPRKIPSTDLHVYMIFSYSRNF